MFPTIAEVFAHSAAREGSQVLQGCGLAGACRDDSGILHGPVTAQGLGNQGHCCLFLPAGNINAVHICFFLGDNSVHANGRLPNLTVTDDKLTLPPAHRRHGVNRFQTGITWLVNTLPVNHARGLHLNTTKVFCVDWTLPVYRGAKGIDNTAKHGFTHRHLGDSGRPLNQVTLFDPLDVTHNGNTDIVLLKVQGDSHDAPGELQKFHGHTISHAIDTGNIVTD